MSSLIFIGIFSLKNNHPVHTTVTKHSGEKINVCHIYYTTAVMCKEPSELPAELCLFKRTGDCIYPDYTTALVIAKGYIPAGDVPGDLLLDALHVAPFPGHPNQDGYDATLPTFKWPLIFGLGSVTGVSTELPEGRVAFPVLMSEYIRGSNKSSTVLYAHS
jgi:hypothetical protein